MKKILSIILSIALLVFIPFSIGASSYFCLLYTSTAGPAAAAGAPGAGSPPPDQADR